jgi:hypothetical protein
MCAQTRAPPWRSLPALASSWPRSWAAAAATINISTQQYRVTEAGFCRLFFILRCLVVHFVAFHSKYSNKFAIQSCADLGWIILGSLPKKVIKNIK